MIYPYVSAIIVVRNEEDYIEKSLISFINQDYPKDKFEIIVVDGMSTDNTVNIVEKLISEKTDYRIRLLKNPKKLLASGWNIAIREAVGEYVTRIDAHAEASTDFLNKSVNTINEISDAVCVGGKLKTVSLSEQGKNVAKILSSPFGVGNSMFRVSYIPQYVDTVAFGLYKKSIFKKVGYFDETLIRNQDNNMHARIRETGGKFYFNPEIKCIYYSRDSYQKMMRQAFLNGKWNIVVFKKDRNSLSVRHLVPLIFVVSLILLGSLSLLFKAAALAFLLELLIYFCCAFLASYKMKSIKKAPKFMALFLLLHVSYGVGSLVSIIKVGGRRNETI